MISKKAIKYVLTFGISIACLYWVFSQVDIAEIWSSIQKANKSYLFFSFIIMFLGYVLRSYRWLFFFGKERPSFFLSFKCVMLGFFANNILPARAGELVRADLCGREANLSRAGSLAAVAGERLADGLTISFMFVTGYLLLPEGVDKKENILMLYVSGFFALACLGVILLLFLRKNFFYVLDLIEKKIGSKYISLICGIVRSFIVGLEPLMSSKKVVVLTFLSGLVWSIELFVYYLITVAFGLELPLVTLIVFLAAVNFSSLVPSSPGAVGVIEAFTTLVLQKMGVDSNVALSMVIVQHVTQMIVVGVPGILFISRYGLNFKINKEEA